MKPSGSERRHQSRSETRGIQAEPLVGRSGCQDNCQAEEELAVPGFLMKAAGSSRNVE